MTTLTKRIRRSGVFLEKEGWRIYLPQKTIAVVGYLYMLIPIGIFLLTWLRFLIGLIAVTVLSYGFYRLLKADYYSRETISIDLRNLLLIVVSICLCCWLAGQGGVFFQTWDNHYRNAIFRDMITHSWPVFYEADGSVLVYYLMQWIVPALVGRVFGWTAANIALFIWDALGILLAVLATISYLHIHNGKLQVLIVFLFMGCGGLHLVASGLTHSLFDTSFTGLSSGNGWNSMVRPGYAFTSGFALLQWVYNQVIVPWIAVPVLLLAPKVEVFMFLGFCVLPFAPFPFVGFVMIMVSVGISRLVSCIKAKQLGQFFKQAFSIPNLTAFFTLFPIFALYYSCNSAATGAEGRGGFGLRVPLSSYADPKRIVSYVLFIFFEFGIYALLIGKRYRKDPIFIGTVISLMAIPLFKVGAANDFMARSCIPALYTIMIYVVHYLLENPKLAARTVLLIFCGAYTMWNFYGTACQSIDEVRKKGTILLSADEIGSLENYPLGLMEDKLQEVPYCNFNFCCFAPQDQFFYKHLADTKNMPN